MLVALWCVQHSPYRVKPLNLDNSWILQFQSCAEHRGSAQLISWLLLIVTLDYTILLLLLQFQSCAEHKPKAGGLSDDAGIKDNFCWSHSRSQSDLNFNSLDRALPENMICPILKPSCVLEPSEVQRMHP